MSTGDIAGVNNKLTDKGTTTEALYQSSANIHEQDISFITRATASLATFDPGVNQSSKLSKKLNSNGTGILIPSTSLKAHKELMSNQEGVQSISNYHSTLGPFGMSDQMHYSIVKDNP